MTYLDLEIEIGPASDDGYPIRAESPVGDGKGTMRFPFEQVALKNHLLNLQNLLVRTTRQALSDEEKQVRGLGKALFESLIHGPVAKLYETSLEAARKDEQEVRLRLRTAESEMLRVPWEYLFDDDAGDFISLTNPLIRQLDLPGRQAGQRESLDIDQPLRILGMTASPEPNPIEEEEEKRRVEDALFEAIEDGRVELRWVPGNGYRDLQKALEGGETWHVFHFIGHGGFNEVEREGYIELVKQRDGTTRRLSASKLARFLGPTIRLVMLNSCLGGLGSTQDIFSSTASQLVRRKLPAVLVMQFAVTNQAAIEFARGFYTALAGGRPIDSAVVSARRSMSVALENSLEWGTPALYMSSKDGALFKPRQRPDLPTLNDPILSKLATWLTLAFDKDQLADFVKSTPDAEKVHTKLLQETDQGLIGAARLAVRRLDAAGLISRTLFDRLAGQHRHQRDGIETLARQWKAERGSPTGGSGIGARKVLGIIGDLGEESDGATSDDVRQTLDSLLRALARVAADLNVSIELRLFPTLPASERDRDFTVALCRRMREETDPETNLSQIHLAYVSAEEIQLFRDLDADRFADIDIAHEACDAWVSLGGTGSDELREQLEIRHQQVRRGGNNRPWLPLRAAGGLSEEIASKLVRSRYGPSVSAMASWQSERLATETVPKEEVLFSSLRALLLFSRRPGDLLPEDVADLVTDVQEMAPDMLPRMAKAATRELGFRRLARGLPRRILATIVTLFLSSATLGGWLLLEQSTSVSDRLTESFVDEVLPGDPNWLPNSLSSLDRKEVRGTLGIRFATGQNTSPRIKDVTQWVIVGAYHHSLKVVHWDLETATDGAEQEPIRILSSATGTEKGQPKPQTLCFSRGDKGPWKQPFCRSQSPGDDVQPGLWSRITGGSRRWRGLLVSCTPQPSDTAMACASFYREKNERKDVQAWALVPSALLAGGGSFDLKIGRASQVGNGYSNFYPVTTRQGDQIERFILGNAWEGAKIESEEVAAATGALDEILRLAFEEKDRMARQDDLDEPGRAVVEWISAAQQGLAWELKNLDQLQWFGPRVPLTLRPDLEFLFVIKRFRDRAPYRPPEGG